MPVTVDEISDLLSQEPPRRIPPSLRKKRRGLLGLVIFGLVFILFSIPFLFLFFPWRIVDEARLDFGSPATTEGRVTAVEKTGMTVGGSNSSPGTPVYRIHFTFTTSDGKSVAAVCYEVGKRSSRGGSATIEYLKSSSSVARIKGRHLDPTGYLGLIVAIFPVAGFIVLAFGLRGRLRYIGLLRNGAFARGYVVAVDATNVHVNNQQRFKISVTYDRDGEQIVTTHNAYGEEVQTARNRMAAGEEVGLLYDRNRSSRVLIMDSLLG